MTQGNKWNQHFKFTNSKTYLCLPFPHCLFRPLIFSFLSPLAPWFEILEPPLSSLWQILPPDSYLDFVSSGSLGGSLLWTAFPCISPVKGLFCELYPNPGLGHSSRALTSRLLSAGGCLSQQYEMTWGDRSVLSPLPYTLLFHQTKSANPSVSFSVMILKSIFLIFHRYSKHKSFEWHKSQCKLPLIHIVWKPIAEFLYMSACKVILVMPDSVRPHGL